MIDRKIVNGRTSVALILLAGLLCSVVYADEPEPKPKALGQRVLVGGWGLPYLAVFDAAGKEEWRIAASGNQVDCWLLDNKSILYTYSGGVREVQRDPANPKGGKILWDFKVGTGGEAHGCQPLPNGDILICENYPKQIEIVEIERGSMKEKFRLKIADNGFSKHGSARQARKTSQGTYLIALLEGAKEGREYDATGKLLRTFPGVRFSLQQLPDGSYLGAGGDDHSVKGFDAQGKEIWKIAANDIPGITIGFAAGVQRLEDGSYLIVNWGGHGGAKGPCVARISADRKTLLGSLQVTPANRVVCFQVLGETKEKE